MYVGQRDGVSREQCSSRQQFDDRRRETIAPGEHDGIGADLPARRTGEYPRVRISNVGTDAPTSAAVSGGGIKYDPPRNSVKDGISTERRRPTAEIERIAAGESKRGCIDLCSARPTRHAGKKDGDQNPLMCLEHRTWIAVKRPSSTANESNKSAFEACAIVRSFVACNESLGCLRSMSMRCRRDDPFSQAAPM